MSDQISQEDARLAIEVLRRVSAHLSWTDPAAPTTLTWGREMNDLLVKYPAAPALRACPHCGCVNIMLDEIGVGADAGLHFAVCDRERGGCGARGGAHRIEADAVRAWNRRP